MRNNVFFFRLALRYAALLSVVMFSVSLLAQTTLYVAMDGDDTTGNGSETMPYRTISNAVAKAEAGDTVLINPGVYTQTTYLEITKDITVRGMNPPGEVIITTHYPDPAYSTRCINMTSAGAVLDGCTIEKGYPQLDGGGILLQAGLVTNCVIRNNQGRYGGGVQFSGGQLLNCEVYNNTSDTRGGGIYMSSDNGGIVSNCTIHANSATKNTSSFGGGVYVGKPGWLITDSIISNNYSAGSGGGILIKDEGFAEIINCTIISNQACVAGGGVHTWCSMQGGAVISNCIIRNNDIGTGYGGGICDGYTISSSQTTTGRLVVAKTRIIANAAQRGAGAWVFTHGTTSFHNCEIIDNYTYITGTANEGAGLFIATSSVHTVIQNCLIASNRLSRGYGGGICVGYVSIAKSGSMPLNLRVESCTIVDNVIGETGYYGGVGVSAAHYPIPNSSFVNCVIVSNTARNYTDIRGGNNYIAPFHYSCSSVLSNAAQGNITDAPVFMSYNSGNYQLVSDSPGVNAGLNQDWMTGAVDLDGRSRIDRVWRQTDMGCYEFTPPISIFRIK